MMDFICVGQHSNIISEIAVWKCQSGSIQTPTETVLTGIITSCQLSVTVGFMRQEKMSCYVPTENFLHIEMRVFFNLS